MNKINEKKQSKKIIIMLLIVILFNFVVPNVAHAGLLLDAFSNLLLVIPDNLMVGLHEIFLGETDIKDDTENYSIKFGPGTIFSGEIPAFDINFIDPDGEKEYKTMGYKEYGESEIVTTEERTDFNTVRTFDGIGQRQEDVEKYVNDNYPEYMERYNNAEQKNSAYDEENTSIHGAPTFDKLTKKYIWVEKHEDKKERWTLTVTWGGWTSGAGNTELPTFKNILTLTLAKETAEAGERMPTISSKLRPMIASWYKVMQELALVGLLSILVYIAIRIILSSAARRKSKI